MDNLPMDNRDCWNNLKEKWNSLPVVFKKKKELVIFF